MDTRRNLSKVFAITLRAATGVIRNEAGSDSRVTLKDALESIDIVAEELEAIADAPDPAGGARG